MEGNENQQIEWFFFILFGTAMFFLLSVVIIFIYNRYRKNKYLQLIKEKEMIASHQRELLKNNIIIQENERKRIASDLHDELGAQISLIKMNIQYLANQSHTNNESGKNILKISELAENALNSTRRISHELMPPTLSTLGVLKTIEMHTVHMQAAGIKMFIHYKDEYRFNEDIELGVYRIVMELLNNTIKHAGATEININFEVTNQLTIIYQDNGIGFETTNTKTKGMGISNIESRVDILGGQINIRAEKGKGLHVTLHIPINK